MGCHFISETRARFLISIFKVAVPLIAAFVSKRFRYPVSGTSNSFFKGGLMARTFCFVEGVVEAEMSAHHESPCRALLAQRVVVFRRTKGSSKHTHAFVFLRRGSN